MTGLKLPVCPRCGDPFNPGTPACPCGRPLEGVGPEPAAADPLPPLAPHGDPPRVVLVLRPEAAGVRFRGKPAAAIEVGPEPLLIGRRDPVAGVHPDVDVGGVADFGYASRRHAEVRADGGRVVVTDVAGWETTAVNDPDKPAPTGVPVPLAAGDRLIIGRAVAFVVEEMDGP